MPEPSLLIGNNRQPPLGAEHQPKRTCTRLLGQNEDGSERLCDAPAVTHIDWGPTLSFMCAEHDRESHDRGWRGIMEHQLGPYCGMPGALWYVVPGGGSFCAYEGDLPTAEPSRAIAQEVPA